MKTSQLIVITCPHTEGVGRLKQLGCWFSNRTGRCCSPKLGEILVKLGIKLGNCLKIAHRYGDIFTNWNVNFLSAYDLGKL